MPHVGTLFLQQYHVHLRTSTFDQDGQEFVTYLHQVNFKFESLINLYSTSTRQVLRLFR